MPIIGSEPIQKNYYRLTITMGGGIVDNILVTPDGLYSVYFIKEGRYYNATGRIPKIVIDYCNPNRSFILFDYSADRSACRERLYFSQVQLIKDVTPNSAYKIAVEHGFVGTVEDWLESLHGDPGKSAYDIAVECGFTGTKEEWLETIKGPKGDDGRSAYQIAVAHGYTGTEAEWLESLKGKDGAPGKDGLSAYELAVQHGYTGTEAEWLESLKGKDGAPGKDGQDGLSAYELAVQHGYSGTEEEWMASMGDVTPVYEKVVNIERNYLTWIVGMEPPAATALKNAMKDPDAAKANMTKVTRVTKA